MGVLLVHERVVLSAVVVEKDGLRPGGCPEVCCIAKPFQFGGAYHCSIVHSVEGAIVAIHGVIAKAPYNGVIVRGIHWTDFAPGVVSEMELNTTGMDLMWDTESAHLFFKLGLICALWVMGDGPIAVIPRKDESQALVCMSNI
jgi:hypothetical protein